MYNEPLITSKTINVEGSEVILYWTGLTEGIIWSTCISDAGYHYGGMFEQVDGIEDIPLDD